MPYCPNCGFKVSRTDIRCSKCGTIVKDESSGPIIGGNSPKTHKIEFILSLIAFLFSLICISAMSYYYSFFIIVLAILSGLIGTLTVRYYAKFGAFILFVAIFGIMMSGANGIVIPVILYAIAALLALFR